MIKLICILILIPYFIWQFKVIKKYGFNFDKLKIDTENKLIIINNRKIKFNDVSFITVMELDQPSNAEHLLTKAAFNYMGEIIFNLKDGTMQKCICNYKGILYKSLTQLQPYIKIDCDIETYKPEGLPNYLTILLLILGTIWIVFSLYHSSNF